MTTKEAITLLQSKVDLISRQEDLISREVALTHIDDVPYIKDHPNVGLLWKAWIESLPVVQPKRTIKRTETHACDCISREAAIVQVNKVIWDDAVAHDVKEVLKELPSVQPERTCVNCGRTVNNGGWYADGRTRCPIEEHYALPKDGYCHLWEKRNVTDDDYPERRTDGEIIPE